ncbi:hypothetical protein SVIOM74S_04107 [Streptomyces violarus]
MEKLVDEVADRRAQKRRRSFYMVAAAGALIIGGPFVAVATNGGGDGGGAENRPLAASPAKEAFDGISDKITATDPNTKVSATVAVQKKDWGTGTVLELKNLKGPLKCACVAVGKNGERETPRLPGSRPGTGLRPAGRQVREGRGAAVVQGGAAFEPNQIDHFEVVTFDGKRLVEVDALLTGSPSRTVDGCPARRRGPGGRSGSAGNRARLPERQEIGVEQEHLDRVYRRLEEKIHEAEFLMNDAAQRGQVGTPGALAERDAQVFRAGIHLSRLNNEFEDFLFGRIDLLRGKDGKKGPDGAYTAVEPAEGVIREDNTADIAETLHIGRIGVLDQDYAPLVIDWRAPAAAPFYRSTPVDPGRVVRRRVIRSKGRRVLGVEDDLMRPELTAFLDGHELPVIGDGALMAALGQARSHTMRDIVASIQAEQDLVIRRRRLRDLRRGRPRHRQGRRRPAPRGLPPLPGPPPVRRRHPDRLADPAARRLHRGRAALPRRGGPGRHPRHRLPRRRRRGHALRLPVRGPRQGLVPHAQGAAQGRARSPGAERFTGPAARGRLRPPPGAGGRATGGHPPRRPRRHRPREPAAPPCPQAAPGRPGEQSGAAGRHTDPELAAELRSSFDEDITSEDSFLTFLDAWWPELTPAAVLDAMADERRLGRWARRILNPGEIRKVARSLKREGRSVHDIAMLDELQAILGAPARPRKRRDSTRWTSSPAWRS